MNNLRELLLIGPTQMLRLWFGLTACFFAIFITSNAAASDNEYTLSFQVMPQLLWAFLLVINGTALVYGSITSRYGKLGLLLEGILGTLLWTALGITSMISQGSLGGITIAIAISAYLLIRYPTWQESL